MLVNKVLTSVAPPLGVTVGLVRAGMTAGTQVLTSIVAD